MSIFASAFRTIVFGLAAAILLYCGTAANIQTAWPSSPPATHATTNVNEGGAK